MEQDLYAQTITETLLKQQQNLASTVTLPSIHRDYPQIHISSFGNYYDIRDFVVNRIDEETVIGGEGEHQVIVKSRHCKPKLETFKSLVDS